MGLRVHGFTRVLVLDLSDQVDPGWGRGWAWEPGVQLAVACAARMAHHCLCRRARGFAGGARAQGRKQALYGGWTEARGPAGLQEPGLRRLRGLMVRRFIGDRRACPRGSLGGGAAAGARLGPSFPQLPPRPDAVAPMTPSW
jgi:hypothetical protein